MLKYLKRESSITYTENGAVTYESTMSDCLDLFATIGAVRKAPEEEIKARFAKAFAENPEIAMKILFFGRDVRGGLGERRVFCVIISWLAEHAPETLRRNIALIPEYGRFDDLVALLDTSCEKDALEVIRAQLVEDVNPEGEVSLLAKWLPSINTSNKEAVRKGRKIAKYLGMRESEYRKMLTELRAKIRIIENNLRERDYTFDYSKQPSKAMLKYKKAFLRNDGERYQAFLENVESGSAKINTGTLAPYEIIAPCFSRWFVDCDLPEGERRAMDVTWNALEDFGGDENALVVVDGSGSMYGWNNALPARVAMSLGIYFAERNKGAFHNHFITFSRAPKLVEIKGRDIAEKVAYCAEFNEVANTDLSGVFELILRAAVKYSVPQEKMPAKLYIVSDMEFDHCIENSELTNFEYARRLFGKHGYKLPEVVFWNVASRNRQQPVTKNEQGVALVSGCTPRLFSMLVGGITSPYIAMMEIIGSERYMPVTA